MAQGDNLKILESYTRDVGRGVARIDYESMDSLSASTGDVIEIRGKRRTVAKCLPLYPSDEGKGIVRVDGLVRNNAGVAIGDTVVERKIKAVPAEKVVVAPLEAIPPIDERGYEVVENYDLGAGPIHIAWIFKPGSECLPDMRLGFVCLTEFSNSSINEAITRAMLNLIDKLVFIVVSESIARKVSNSINDTIPEKPSLIQLRKYVTVFTPSMLTSKSDVQGARSHRTE